MAQTVRIVGLEQLKAKLAGPPRIYVKPVQRAMRASAAEAAKVLRSRATKGPRKQLSRSIRPRTRASGLFAGVEFNPIASQGKGRGAAFRSGWAFDASSKFTPRNGGMTTGWIREVPGLVAGSVNQRLQVAMKETEALWNG